VQFEKGSDYDVLELNIALPERERWYSACFLI
jgi:hypothetical protein